MLYTIPLTIPANTPATAPVETSQVIDRGVITRVEVQFPSGCAGLAHVRIIVGERQVWPTDPDTTFIGDGQNISWADDYSLLSHNPVVRVQGWNLDDTYQHIPIVRIVVAVERTPLVERLRSALMN